MTIIIGVVGGTGQGDKLPLDLAREVGREVTRRQHVLLSGGHYNDRCDVKGACMVGALENQLQGKVIGVLPKQDKCSIMCDNIYRAIFVNTTLHSGARNVLNGSIPSCLIALKGGAGTLSEIAFALHFGRPVYLLRSKSRLIAEYDNPKEKCKFKNLYEEASVVFKNHVLWKDSSTGDKLTYEQFAKRLVDYLNGAHEATEATKVVEDAVNAGVGNHVTYEYLEVPGVPKRSEFDEKYAWLTGPPTPRCSEDAETQSAWATRQAATVAMESFRFTTDWFGLNIPIWQQFLSPLAGVPELRFLEIGTFEGRVPVWLLGNIATHESARIDCVDPFDGPYEQNFDHNIQTAMGQHKVTKLKGRSQHVLRTLSPDWYDAIYVDGSHEAPDVMEDAVLAFALLKPGGLMIFDDYEWDVYQDPLLMPKIAIDAFLRVYQRRCEMLHKGYQVVIRKR